MFSPFYAWSRRRGAGDPANHCALNVALYGRPRRWAMTERGRAAVSRSADRLAIGPSALQWDGACLTVDIAEMTAPLPLRMRGRVRIYPVSVTRRTFTLDAAGRHRWSPIGPAARVEVAMQNPALRWSGEGYLDSNEGDRALEDDFVAWNWCRAPASDGAVILYDVTRRDGGEQTLALRVGGDGRVESFAPPPRAQLARTKWGLARPTRSEPGATPRVRQTLQDVPFYASSVIETRLAGQQLTAVHESLSLDRFRAPWVQAMLPFRIPRRF